MSQEAAMHPAKRGQLPPKVLAERRGVRTRDVNMALEAVGFIERFTVRGRRQVRITEEGKEFGGYHTLRLGRITVVEIRWDPNVLDFLLL